MTNSAFSPEFEQFGNKAATFRRTQGISNMGTQLSLAAMRQNLRRLSKQRGFTLTVLLTLGLCIGANIAIFAIVDAVLL
jgi:hypothetical protein